MSHGMEKDLARFAATLWLDLDGHQDDERYQLFDPEGWSEEYGTEKIDEGGIPILGDNFSVRNWRFVGFAECGKNRRHYAPQWTDGTHSVWLLNESQYCNVGCFDITGVADDRESLEAFIADFRDILPVTPWACNIKASEPIVQWG